MADYCEKCDKKQPPESGEIHFTFFAEPISQQSCGKRKGALKQIIKSETSLFEYLLTCEVTVGITWYGNERRRFETDKDPDVDNIIKPILDALVGPSGILIDDCQVQHVSCSWVDTNGIDTIDVDIKFYFRKFIMKSALVFVQFDNAICVALNHSDPAEHDNLVKYVEMIGARWAAAKEFEKNGDIQSAQEVKPFMMHFHKTRIGGFPVVLAKNIKEYLASVST